MSQDSDTGSFLKSDFPPEGRPETTAPLEETEDPPRMIVSEVLHSQAGRMKCALYGEERPLLTPQQEDTYRTTEETIKALSQRSRTAVFIGNRNGCNFFEAGSMAGSDEFPLGVVYNPAEFENPYNQMAVSTYWPGVNRYKLESSIRDHLRDIETVGQGGELIVQESTVTFIEGAETRTVTKKDLRKVSMAWLMLCYENSAKKHASGESCSMLVNYLDEKIFVPRQLEAVRAQITRPEPPGLRLVA